MMKRAATSAAIVLTIAAGTLSAGDEHVFCRMPAGRPADPAALAVRGGVLVVAEQENNDTLGQAQALTLSVAGDAAIDVDASLSNDGDLDWYRVQLNKGDILGAAMDAGGNPDGDLRLFDAGGSLIKRTDEAGFTSFYPASNPLPRGSANFDAALSFIVPETGTYYLRAGSYLGNSDGAYTLELRVFRNALESFAPARRQIIFLDFDGASINAPALFGNGNNPANLSGLASFLDDWGLSPADESAVIDSIIATVQENLDDLASVNPAFSVELRNSRDHADPWGQPDVSRVIIGGTAGQLGFSTIGIAESIDPGNFAREETAVVLLDILSSSTSSLSFNNIPRAPGFTKIQAIGIGTGNIVAHEFGHYSGNWHTQNGNSLRNLMDAGGGSILQNLYGTGPDEIYGTADDVDVDFFTDEYETEGVATGNENTTVRMAYAFGTLLGDCPGDVTGDGFIDFTDLNILLASFGDIGTGLPADINGDGVVGFTDLNILLTSFGESCV